MLAISIPSLKEKAMTQKDLLTETRIVWIDVESNGLHPSEGANLLEIAGIVTDGNLEESSEVYHSTVKYDASEVAGLRDYAVPYVQAMHDATGLWDRLPAGKELSVIDAEMVDWMKACGVKEGAARLGGNSITLDRNFLQFNLPRTLNWLHYRSLDMSSITGFVELWRPELPLVQKETTHAALDDIRESIMEARHWRKLLGASH